MSGSQSPDANPGTDRTSERAAAHDFERLLGLDAEGSGQFVVEISAVGARIDEETYLLAVDPEAPGIAGIAGRLLQLERFVAEGSQAVGAWTGGTRGGSDGALGEEDGGENRRGEAQDPRHEQV